MVEVHLKHAEVYLIFCENSTRLEKKCIGVVKFIIRV